VTPINFQVTQGSSGDWLMPVLIIYGLVWLVVLANLLQRRDFDPVTKLTWVIVVIFVPFFGILLYWGIALSMSKKFDAANQLSGTPWENDPGHTSKSR
jgi:hypothetical protein